MFVDYIMVDRADEREPIEHFRAARQMLANSHTVNRRVHRGIVGPWLLGFEIAPGFRIPGIDLTRAPAKPNEDAVLRFAEPRRVRVRVAMSKTGSPHRGG